MNIGRTVFAQLMDFVPSYEFQKCVQRYNGNYKMITFSCLDQFLYLSFAQLTYRESLRDIEACLRGAKHKLYHMGIRSKVSRNTLAHANEARDWRIYADFAQVLITTARQLYASEDFGLELDQTVYAFDSTTIDLCLSVFPWAKFRRKKAAIKLHTLLDLRGNIPVVISMTEGRVHDVNALDDLFFEAGSIYIFDRAYVDFARLYRIHQSLAFFVTRAKSNFVFKRLYSLPVDKSTGVRADQIIITTTGFYTLKDYPDYELWFADDVRFDLLPVTTYMYRQQGESLLIPTPGKNIRVAVCGALRSPEGPFVFSHGPKSVNSRLFVDLLQKLQRRAHRTGKRIVLVLDNGREHTSRLSLSELDRLKSAIRVFWLPTYTSEQINDIEAVWKHLKEDSFSRMLVTDDKCFYDTVIRLLSVLQQPHSLRKMLPVFQNLLRAA